ncbi:hypothetical protein O181_031760 [Austropuccinia psidii MF-1]|uniref:Uncharacterized protein n=1 Tax=Austropuccinia psidii MF-1 TaxID=1389203 RepID=A0A9Q3CYI2_9BASI|nr:hypothetical protein [Austropuccinia psidii MF-1]
MYGGMPPYACPGPLVLSRIPTRRTQILTPVQDPDTSHTKPCTVNPYAGEAFQKLRHFLMRVQDPNTSRANPYSWAGSQSFMCTSLHLYRFPTIQTIPYAWEAS